MEKGRPDVLTLSKTSHDQNCRRDGYFQRSLIWDWGSGFLGMEMDFPEMEWGPRKSPDIFFLTKEPNLKNEHSQIVKNV